MALFSATLPSWVHSIAQRFMKPERQTVDVTKSEKVKTSHSVQHLAMVCGYHARAPTLGDVLTIYAGLHGRCIVFTETKAQANEIALSSSIKDNCQALHGDIPQSQREVTLKAFKSVRGTQGEGGGEGQRQGHCTSMRPLLIFLCVFF